MADKTCKCGKPLPMNYKHKKCEHCMNLQAETLRKAGKIGGALLSLVLLVATKGKFNSRD